MGMELGKAICKSDDPWEGVDYLYAVLHAGFLDKIHPSGSREICNPPVMDTDFDVIALASEKTQNIGIEAFVAIMKVIGGSK